MAVNSHLELRVPTGENARDQLRDELAQYAVGSVMLDGVSRDIHQQLIVNNSYNLDVPGAALRPDDQEEKLF